MNPLPSGQRLSYTGQNVKYIRHSFFRTAAERLRKSRKPVPGTLCFQGGMWYNALCKTREGEYGEAGEKQICFCVRQAPVQAAPSGSSYDPDPDSAPGADLCDYQFYGFQEGTAGGSPADDPEPASGPGGIFHPAYQRPARRTAGRKAEGDPDGAGEHPVFLCGHDRGYAG